MKDRIFHTASNEEIKSGNITDVYFQRTQEILKELGNTSRVTMEVRTTHLPKDYPFAVLAGIEEVSKLFEGVPVNVESYPEGTFFFAWEPVMTISGKYIDFGLLETALLGLLCQASGIATRAARCKKAAGSRMVLSFGARRMHPAIAPMIERSAYIGGCDGVAVVKSAELLGEEPSGTIPHALILLLGDTVEATKAFDRIINPKIKRVALVDTFQDEKFEALRVAEAMGDHLFAIRLDTPETRRGDMLRLLEEVRWELDLRGHKNIKLFVSGGLDEYEILRLNPFTDAYGVGTALSNAPVINFSLDIVEIDSKPAAKRGKRSSRKQVYQCEVCGKRVTVPAVTPLQQCECSGKMVPLQKQIMENGAIVDVLPDPKKIREFVLKQLENTTLNL